MYWNQLRKTAVFLAFILVSSSMVSAQQLVIPENINANSFSDGSLFKFTYNSAHVSESRQVEARATLWLDGNQIAEETSSALVGPVAVGSIFHNGTVISLSEEFDPLFLTLGMLPEGSYKLCVELIDGQSRTKVCKPFYHQVRANPLHIRLASPYHNSILTSSLPLLVWSSSIFPNVSNALSYELKVFEGDGVRKSGVQSLTQGMYILVQSQINTPVFQYPVEAVKLEDDKQYYWQVDLRVGQRVIARSEVWNFTLKRNELYEALPIFRGYIDLSEAKGDQTLYLLGNLSIKQKPKGSNSNVEVTVFADEGEKEVARFNMTFSRGEPYAIQDLTEFGAVKHLKTYTVEMKEQGDVIHSFKFVFVNPYVN